MLVIANGSFKSGSTWQRNLFKGLMDFQPLPEMLRRDKQNSFINKNRLVDIVKSSEIRANNYLAKAHIYKKDQIERLTSNVDDIKFFMIKRDIRDARVSHYIILFAPLFKLSFKTYYWLVGRYKAVQLTKYNKIWAPFQQNVFHSTFEALKRDTSGELKRFAEFLGVTIDEKEIDRIIKINSLKKIREKSNRK